MVGLYSYFFCFRVCRVIEYSIFEFYIVFLYIFGFVVWLKGFFVLYFYDFFYIFYYFD